MESPIEIFKSNKDHPAISTLKIRIKIFLRLMLSILEASQKRLKP